MHSFNGLLKVALIVAVMICIFGHGVEGLICYKCADDACFRREDKFITSDHCQPRILDPVCYTEILRGGTRREKETRNCGPSSYYKSGNFKRGSDTVHVSVCSTDYCNNGSGSGRLDSNVGLLIGLLMVGISLWFVIGSSSSGRLSFSPNH